MSFKLGALASVAANVAAPSRMVVMNADTDRPLLDSEKKECFIDFYSVDSEAGRKLDRMRGVALMRKMRSGRNRIDEDDDPIEQQVEMLATLAAGWNFGPDAEPFSKEAATALFSNPEFSWLRKQAAVFVNVEANFIKGSSKN